MGKVSRTSDMRKSRIHSNYVEQNHSVSGTKGVGKVEPSHRTQNNTDLYSQNYLIASDNFYDNLRKLSKEYKRFYHRERELEQAIEDIYDQKEKLVEYMATLINKYNKAIISLEELDKEIGTEHASHIKNIVINYRRELNSVGINIIRNKELEIDKEIFEEKIIESDDAMERLFKPIRGMIMKIYKAFRNIKMPRSKFFESEYNDSEYSGMSPEDYSGILMDQKS